MSIILGLILLLGIGGGTVMVADNATPGDLLFPLDRGIESARLAISGGDEDKKLKLKFAEERVSEAEELLLEKADIVEDSGTATSSESEENDEDIAEALSSAIELLEGTDGNYDELISRFNQLLGNFPDESKIEIKVSDSGASFIKIEAEDGDSNKFNVEVKQTGGENILIKQRLEDSKVEVEIENENEKVKIKVEDDGKVEIETENESEDDTVEVEVEDEDEGEELEDTKTISEEDDDQKVETEDSEDSEQEDD